MPLSLSSPVPVGWLVTGFTGAGDDLSGIRGCWFGLSGPDPVGGPGEMLVISEEPGLGLGAGLAGLDGPDPGEGFAAGPPHALVQFGNHEFPLWSVESPGAAVFAGEVLANWLWIILWPDTARHSPAGAPVPAGPAGSRAGTGRPVRRALAAAALLKDAEPDTSRTAGDTRPDSG